MMGALHVLLISAIAVQMVVGENALSESEVDRQARRPQDCDSTTYSNRGVIYSPGYPSNYANSLDCRTRIIPQISSGYNIKFYFCDFSTETGFIGCADSVKLGTADKLCGDRSNKIYQSPSACVSCDHSQQLSETSDHVKLMFGSSVVDTSSGSFDVTFKSDRTITKRGYKIAFCAGCANVADAKALCHSSSTTRRPLTKATTRRPLTTATTRRPLTRPTTRRPLTRATTRRPLTRPTTRRQQTTSRFTYPRHKRGFFFNKKTTPSFFTYPTGRFTYPFTFRYPQF